MNVLKHTMINCIAATLNSVIPSPTRLLRNRNHHSETSASQFANSLMSGKATGVTLEGRRSRECWPISY